MIVFLMIIIIDILLNSRVEMWALKHFAPWVPLYKYATWPTENLKLIGIVYGVYVLKVLIL